MEITGVHSTTVVVTDQDRALTFYRDVLGAELVFDGEVLPGARLVVVSMPGSPLPVLLLTQESGLPLGVRYHVADADAAHRDLVAAGVTPHTEVLHLGGNPPMFTCSDPDGNTVILMQSPSEGLPAAAQPRCSGGHCDDLQ